MDNTQQSAPAPRRVDNFVSKRAMNMNSSVSSAASTALPPNSRLAAPSSKTAFYDKAGTSMRAELDSLRGRIMMATSSSSSTTTAGIVAPGVSQPQQRTPLALPMQHLSKKAGASVGPGTVTSRRSNVRRDAVLMNRNLHEAMTDSLDDRSRRIRQLGEKVEPLLNNI